MEKIHFIAAQTDEAQAALKDMAALYGQADLIRADVIVALGGDGTMLQALHDSVEHGLPVYGMNRGSLGFLLNPYRPEDLRARLSHAHKVVIHPLQMTATDAEGRAHNSIAFNEVSLLRQVRQAAKLRISVDGVERLPELICDGILVATPAGSTAYNLSAHGPIIPLGSNVLALTPISAFRPRRWRGALLPEGVQIRIDILEADKRPVSATADDFEVRNVRHVEIVPAPAMENTILFDPDYSLEERVIKEQFMP